MSVRIHCQSCGRSTPVEVEPALILPTKLEVLAFTGGSHEADLCLSCRTKLLARYFGIEPGATSRELAEREALMGPPEMPTFLEEALVEQEATG